MISEEWKYFFFLFKWNLAEKIHVSPIFSPLYPVNSAYKKKPLLNCDPVQLVLEIFDWNQQCCKYLCSEVLENRPQAETTLLLWFAIFEDPAGSILRVRVTNSHQQGSTGGFRGYSHLGKVFFWDASLPLTSQDQHSFPRLSVKVSAFRLPEAVSCCTQCDTGPAVASI